MPINLNVSGKTPNGDVQTLAIDSYHRTAGVIEINHLKVHEGTAFALSHTEASLGAGVNIQLVLVTSTTPIHLKTKEIEISSDKVEVKFYEDIEGTSTETPIAAWGLNRISTSLPRLSISSETPVDLSAKTPILPYTLVASTTGGPHATPSPVSEDKVEEWILKPEIRYVLDIKNSSANVIDTVEVLFFWYY